MMVTVVGVRFKPAGKVYYFDPGDFELTEGTHVIVETARGLEFGEVTLAPCEVSQSTVIQSLKKVIRVADEEDEEIHAENVRKKREALEICQEKIEFRELDMKLIDVEYTFDNTKVIFYFTADGRVDFRELVKDLASVFKMRIELRQIGVRDEAKMLGGIGTCGKGLCCNTWLPDFDPVSIKMAKLQGLSLNPAKISGICGRLMCCLKYENDVYTELKQGLPDVGDRIKTPDGPAVVVESNVLKEQVKAALISDNDKGEERSRGDINTYTKSEIKRIEKKRYKKEEDDDLESLPEEVKSLLED